MKDAETLPDSPRTRSAFRVRAYRPGDEHGILVLFGRAFPGVARDLAVWHWLYRDAPQGARITIAEADDGRIVAHYASIQMRVRYRGEERSAGLGVDSMVDPEWRRLGRRGPFLATADAYFQSLGDPSTNHVAYGFPNALALRFGVRQLAYRVVHERFPALFLNSFERRPLRRLFAFGGGCRVSPVTRFGARHAALWLRLRSHFGLALCRDPGYLNWRYVDAPLQHDCREIVGRDGELRGLFVLRRHWGGQPIVAMVDLLVAPDDRDALACALQYAVGPVRAGEAARLELWLPPESPWFAQALALGLRAEPSLFTMACRLARSPDELDWHRANWYFTIGDSDVW